MSIIKRIFGIRPTKRTDVPNGLRGTGVSGGKGIFDEYFNQILFEIQADHIIDTEVNVKLANDPRGTCYYNSTATEFQDSSDATVTFSDGDKILWRGLDAISAAINISTIDDLEHIMFQGVAIALGVYGLDLGENQRGELDLSGTGTLTVLSSDGLRVKNSGLTIDNQAGDIIINNRSDFSKSANIEYKNIVVKYASASTLNITIDSLKLLDENNNPLVVDDIDETLDITSDIHAGSEKASTHYRIWMSANDAGAIAGKLVPDIDGVTDGTTASKLIDSTADFVTDAIQVGDIVHNTTDFTKTKVTAIDDLNTLSVADDIFVSGENYTIHILSPTLDSGYTFKADIGSAYNDSGSDFDPSFEQKNNIITITGQSAIAGGTSSAYAPVPMAAIIPLNAKSVSGLIEGVDTGSGNTTVDVFLTPYSTGDGQAFIRMASTSSFQTTSRQHYTKSIIDVQTLYYKIASNTNTASVTVESYTI